MRLVLKHLKFIVLAALVSACSSTPDKPDEGVKTNGMVAQEFFVQGVQKLDNEDYAGAVADFKQASKRHVERWDIHMNMAIAYSRDAKFNEAINAITLAFQNGGDKEPLVYFNLGNIYQERGLYAEAVAAYRAGLAVGDPKDLDMLVNLGAAYLFSFEYENATATYEYVRSIAPDDPRPVHGLGLVLQAQNRYADALDMYEQANMLAPNFAQTYFNKSWVLAALGRWDDAIRSMETYLEKDPGGPYASRAKTHIRFYKNKLEKPS